MKEEYHGIFNGSVTTDWQQKYGWGTINASVWLPSLSELVGYDPNNAWVDAGVYFSAMQGLNISSLYYTDTQGGTQFAYFKQYNASGGGKKLWNAVQKQTSWARSCVCLNADRAWRITDDTRFDWAYPTDSHAVHPAVSLLRGKQIITKYSLI